MKKLTKTFIMMALAFVMAFGGIAVAPTTVDAKAVTVVCHHKYTYKKVTKYATCTKSGRTNVICRLCGKKVKTLIDKELGHDWDSGCRYIFKRYGNGNYLAYMSACHRIGCGKMKNKALFNKYGKMIKCYW